MCSLNVDLEVVISCRSIMLTSQSFVAETRDKVLSLFLNWISNVSWKSYKITNYILKEN